MTYNEQETEESKAMWHIKDAFTRQGYDLIPAGLPIKITCEFGMPVPASMAKKWRLAIQAGYAGPPHVKKPDVDNMLKFLKDCCNGIVWHDDAQVTEVAAAKQYKHTPSTYLRVEWPAEGQDVL
jgi:Holliday junction resolvase RusA-like endonuclease